MPPCHEQTSMAVIEDSKAKASIMSACCNCASCASHVSLSGNTGHRDSWGPLCHVAFLMCPHQVQLAKSTNKQSYGMGEMPGTMMVPPPWQIGARAMPTALGAAGWALPPMPGPAGLSHVHLPFREAWHLPTCQPRHPYAGRLHQPVQDRCQLLRGPEVLQEWLWQGLLCDTHPLRSVGCIAAPGIPQHHGTVPVHPSHSQPLLLCRCSRLLPAQPRGSCCPMPIPHVLVLVLHRPRGLEPSASVFSLGFSARCEPPALSPIKQLLPVMLWLPLHPTPWSPLCSMLWPPLHHEPWLPLHPLPGMPGRTSHKQQHRLTVMPPRVPSLCPAWCCPMGSWPQLSLHSSSTTLGPPPCSEHSC